MYFKYIMSGVDYFFLLSQKQVYTPDILVDNNFIFKKIIMHSLYFFHTMQSHIGHISHLKETGKAR